MPHPIVEIDELVRLVINELVETSPGTAVSFALTCRSLEEPTLSSLWKCQWSLDRLLRVLPSCTLREDVQAIVSGQNFSVYHIRYRFPQVFKRDPSAEDWARLQRYASWMRGLHLDYDNYGNNALSRLSSNSPGGLLFPKLESLDWDLFEAQYALPFFHLFLSPNLRRVTLYASLSNFRVHLLAPLVQMVSLLPTSLEYMSVMYGRGEDELFNDAVSSFICQCGPLLRSFTTSVPISEAATDHIMRLPNLSHWATAQAPPRVVPTSMFPSLESILLYEPVALPWLHLLASHEMDVLRNDFPSVTSHTNARETLKSCNCFSTIIDSTLLSSVMKFDHAGHPQLSLLPGRLCLSPDG